VDLGALNQAAYLEILKRLQGSGYASDDSSNRVKELNAIAKMAAMVSEAIGAASRNLFLSSAAEALDMLESVRLLPQDSSLTYERRRSRLIAVAQGGAKLVAARVANAIATYLGAPAGTAVTGLGSDVAAHSADAFGALLYGRLEPSADKHELRDLAPILTRGLPARAIDGGISADEAEWGSAIGDSIAVVPSTAIPAQTKARTAPLAFYPGSIIARQQWQEIQAMLCFKSRGFSVDQDLQGRWIFVDVVVPASDFAIVDGPTVNSGIDWRNRFVQGWGTITATTLIDTTALGAGQHVWLSASKTGTAGVTHGFVGTEGSNTDVTITADLVTGDLIIGNNNAGDRYVKLFVRSTAQYVEGTSTDTQPWIDIDEMQILDGASLFHSQIISEAGEPGGFAGAPAGAIRRVVYTGPLSKTSDASHVHRVILDSSEDWRNRWVLVVPITLASTGAPPSANVRNPTARGGSNSRPRLFYTGNGVAPGQETAQPLQHPDSIASPNVWIYADQDGLLRAEMKAIASTDSACCLMALIVATERDDGSSVVTPVPADATLVQTLDLEQPQNCGVYAQGQQGGPRYSIEDPPLLTRPTCPPLGLISEGQTPLRPVSWLVRERLGAVDDGVFERRQPIFSQRRRVASITATPNASTPFDVFNDWAQVGVADQMDFADRLVWVEGRFSTTDIRIAAAVASDAAATRFSALFYAGPVDDVSVQIASDLALVFELPNEGLHSRLVVQNSNPATSYYVNAVIETSGHIGLTNLRGTRLDNSFQFAGADLVQVDPKKGFADDLGTIGGEFVE